MTPQFLNKARVIRIVVWAVLGFCLVLFLGHLIRIVSGKPITLEQIATGAGILSIPGSIVASAVGWMRSQLEEVRDEIKSEVQLLQRTLDGHEQLMNGILVSQGAHEKLLGHPGIVEAVEKLKGTVLRTEAQVEVFGRFQKIYEQQVKLSEEVAYLKGLVSDGKNSNC